jgi:ABC-type glycerol-3-phosphate transport system permease component
VTAVAGARVRPARRGFGSQRWPLKSAAYVAMAAISFFMIFPFLWMVVSSLKPFAEIFAGDSFLPRQPTLDNYTRLFEQGGALLKIWNSFFIATVYTVVAVLLCALGGYAFAKFPFPGRRALFALMLATITIPFAVVMIPLFIMMRNVFDWIDTPWPLIVPTAANAFGIFFMRQYLLALPDEMLDAARVDGASELQIFTKIVLPTSIPGLVSLAIIFFMARWNDFLWPLAVLRSDEARTVPLMLIALQGPPGRTAYDLLMAGSVVSVLPMLALFLLLQRHLVAGVTTGAVKG